MNSRHPKSFACYLLITLHIFLGIGALFSGAALILIPDGSILQLPLNILEHTPFQSFLIPGLILFIGLGIVPSITAIFLILEKPFIAEKLSIYKDTHWSWNSSLYISFILIIWITVQIYLTQLIEFIQVFYIFLGLLIMAITLLPSVKMHYSNTNLSPILLKK